MYQAQCLRDLVRHRDLHEQKLKDAKMEDLRRLCGEQDSSARKSKVATADMLVLHHCQVLNL